MDIIDIALARKNVSSGSSITSIGTDQIQDGAVTLEKLDSNVVEQIGLSGGADVFAGEGEDGHIANMPFGSKVTITELVNGTFTIDESGYCDEFTPLPYPIDWIPYIVEVDGTEYEVTWTLYPDHACIGNRSLYADYANFVDRTDYPDTGEPFYIHYYNTDDSDLYIKTSDYASNDVAVKIIGPIINGEFKKISAFSCVLDGHLIRRGTGDCSEIFNYAHEASGYGSHAEGNFTTASGNDSHAEGYNTIASGNGSHAEGSTTIANGNGSHAEGSTTTASGSYSHAEGYNTTASGYASHAEGSNIIAAGQFQHVSGKYNIEDTSNTYAEIIGNGSRNNRSNARTLDWSGNEWLAGGITVNSTNGITIGSTTINETQLQNLLALLN